MRRSKAIGFAIVFSVIVGMSAASWSQGWFTEPRAMLFKNAVEFAHEVKTKYFQFTTDAGTGKLFTSDADGYAGWETIHAAGIEVGVVYCDTSAELVAAASPANTDAKVVVTSANITLSAPLTIPSGKTYKSIPGAILTTTAVNTLTFSAGSHLEDNGGQMFSCAAGELVINGTVSNRLSPDAVGADKTAPDNSTALNIWAALGCPLKIEGTYPVTDTVTIPFGADIEAVEAVIDGGDAAAVFSSGTYVLIVGGVSVTALPDLGAEATAGAVSLTFASAPTLVRGDIVAMWNPTNGSWCSYQNAYRSGEFARVTYVDGVTVYLDAPLYEGGAVADMNMYKLNGGRVDIRGSLKVVGPDVAVTPVPGILLSGLIDSDISGLKAETIGSSALTLSQCMHISGRGIIANQAEDRKSMAQYGLVIGSSQHIRLSGAFKGERHGVTLTSSANDGGVVTRDVHIDGLIEGDNAADVHMADYYKFSGMVRGGVMLGGDHGEVDANVTSNEVGNCIKWREMRGWSFKLRGRCTSYVNPYLTSSMGVIDLAGNDDAAGAHTVRGGTVDMSGLTIDAPTATRLLHYRNRGSVPGATDPIKIILAGLKIERFTANPAVSSIYGFLTSGDAFTIEDWTGLAYPAGCAVPHPASVAGLVYQPTKGVSADYGNAAGSLYGYMEYRTHIWNTELTADRAVALSTTATQSGAKFRIVRTAAAIGAFNLNVGTGPLKALGIGEWCEVEFNGAAWVLTAYGTL